MNALNRILVVDDEPLNQGLIKLALQEEYELGYANSGRECLHQTETAPPDLVLLDVKMPEMDGYETCRQLKAADNTLQTPVIFVSALESLEERLAGYEAGAEDFITKPFENDELRAKVSLALKNKEIQARLQQDAKGAMDTAMVAIKSAGELGDVLNFLRTSFTCTDYETLGTEILTTMEHNGLNCAVQIRAAHGNINMDTRGVAKPLIVSLLEAVSQEKRIFDFDNRTVFNFDSISLLIKNMPMDDPETYGRIKDNVALLVEGADARIKSIDMEQAMAKQKQAILAALEGTRHTLRDIGDKHRQHKQDSTHLLEMLLQDLEASFLNLGLTEEQETHLFGMVNETVNKTIANYDQSLKEDHRMDSVVDAIQGLLET